MMKTLRHTDCSSIWQLQDEISLASILYNVYTIQAILLDKCQSLDKNRHSAKTSRGIICNLHISPIGCALFVFDFIH